MLTGNAQLGESCSSSNRCAAVPGETVRCGIETQTCQKLVPVQEGRPCDYEAPAEWSNCSVTVDPDFYCDYATSTCRKRPGLGETCSQAADCVLGQTCSGGTCVARVAIGGDCSEMPCVLEAYCADSNVCVADKTTGDACENGSQCPFDYCDDETKVCAGLGPIATCWTDPA